MHRRFLIGSLDAFAMLVANVDRNGVKHVLVRVGSGYFGEMFELKHVFEGSSFEFGECKTANVFQAVGGGGVEG